jgi:small subunit ribosomal protein S9
MAITYINALGRRKTSVARVYLSPGSGTITVNGKDYKAYFPVPHLVNKITQPFELAGLSGAYDVKANVTGGGIKGQVEAIVLGISRALVKIDEAHRAAFKPEKLLTRDPRMVERKKFGRKKARKSFQFSKR